MTLVITPDELKDLRQAAGIGVDYWTKLTDADQAVLVAAWKALRGLKDSNITFGGDAWIALFRSVREYTERMGRFWERTPGQNPLRESTDHPDAVNALVRNMVLTDPGSVYGDLSVIYTSAFKAIDPDNKDARDAIRALKIMDFLQNAKLQREFRDQITRTRLDPGKTLDTTFDVTPGGYLFEVNPLDAPQINYPVWLTVFDQKPANYSHWIDGTCTLTIKGDLEHDENGTATVGIKVEPAPTIVDSVQTVARKLPFSTRNETDKPVGFVFKKTLKGAKELKAIGGGRTPNPSGKWATAAKALRESYDNYRRKRYCFGLGYSDAESKSPSGSKTYLTFNDGLQKILSNPQGAQQVLKDNPKLHEHELTALILYTSNFYEIMNPAMRGLVDSETDRAHLVTLLKLATAGINKLNESQIQTDSGKFRTPTIRGDGNVGFLHPRVKDNWFADLSFFSTAMNVEGPYNLWGTDKRDHVFTIFLPPLGNNFSGCADVAFLSFYGAGESEMLFRPGTRFRVENVLDLSGPQLEHWPDLWSAQAFNGTPASKQERDFIESLKKDWKSVWDKGFDGHVKMLKRVYTVRQYHLDGT